MNGTTCMLKTLAGAPAGPVKDPAIEYNLPCTLEELYKGSTRKMKIQRTVPEANGQSTRVAEVLEVGVRPGWKKGTKVTFANKGQQPTSN